jgi:hypothetical protein
MMGLMDDLFIGIGINHGRGDRLVPQHLLQDGRWHPGLGRIPAKSVPPGVRIELLIVQGGSFGGPMEDLVNAAVG